MAEAAGRRILLKFRLANRTSTVRDDRHRKRMASEHAAHDRMSRFVIGRLFFTFFLIRHGCACRLPMP